MYRNLKQPEDRYRKLYEDRVTRLRKLIDLKAPISIIGIEARMVAECFQYTLGDRFRRWHLSKCPTWLLWLTSSDYRQVCRENPDSGLGEE